MYIFRYQSFARDSKRICNTNLNMFIYINPGYTLESRKIFVEVELNDTLGGSIPKFHRQRFSMCLLNSKQETKDIMLLFSANKIPGLPPLVLKWTNFAHFIA